MINKWAACRHLHPTHPELHAEYYLTRMRSHLIQAKWAEDIHDDDGALQHQLMASIMLELAMKSKEAE